jgi:hypothetical protein
VSLFPEPDWRCRQTGGANGRLARPPRLGNHAARHCGDNRDRQPLGAPADIERLQEPRTVISAAKLRLRPSKPPDHGFRSAQPILRGDYRTNSRPRWAGAHRLLDQRGEGEVQM